MAPRLGLYIHMPWCVSKCPYCDFNSHALKGELPGAAYIDALSRDLSVEKKRVNGRTVRSIFIGGGTPSVFQGGEIACLLSAARAQLTVADDCEVTMEANPGTVEHGRLADYRAAGVNRLSMGVQSFDDRHLKSLGRLHDGKQARRAFAEARAAGFENINLDLMYGLPGQTVDEALADVDMACRLGPEHVSHYQLTLEPNTVFYASPPELPNDDATWEMLEVTQARLSESDYRRYEVSAFSRPGRECRHNLNYWRFGDYLGIGAGAHGKVTCVDGSVLRSRKPAHPRAYQEAMQGSDAAATQLQPINGSQQVFEFMLNAVRLTGGFTFDGFEPADVAARELLSNGLDQAETRGLLRQVAPGRWCPTDLGFRFLNDLQALFLP